MNSNGRLGALGTSRRAWTRVIALGAITAVTAVATPGLSWAQSAYPNKPIRVIVPFPAGSPPDVIARTWADKMRQALGQPLIIDNRPGAATIIGAQASATAPADGYTLMYTAQNTLAINPSVYKNLPYKVSDFTPVSHTVNVPLVLSVAVNSPIKSFADLIQAAKAAPGKLNYASYGIGQGTHVAMARMLNAAGVTMTHVPYQNGGLADVMTGVVDTSFDASTAVIPQIKGGKLRPLAVSSAKRIELLPDSPAVAEVLPGFNGDSWHGVFVRTGTSPEIVNRLAAESQKIIDSADFRAHLRDFGLVPAGGTPAEFVKFLDEDSRAWAKVVKDNNIQIAQ
jgi:tripartite-type tricarboxylate transporter receptor subunit TctC